jgi:hypothetical protein
MNKEELLAPLGQPHKVLDKGHVHLVDLDTGRRCRHRVRAYTFSRQEMDFLRFIAKDWLETCEAYAEGEGKDFNKRKLMRDRATEFNMGSSRERLAFWKALGVL